MEHWNVSRESFERVRSQLHSSIIIPILNEEVSEKQQRFLFNLNRVFFYDDHRHDRSLSLIHNYIFAL